MDKKFFVTNIKNKKIKKSNPTDCSYLLVKLPQAKVSPMVREANKCADWLAKCGCEMKEDSAVFEFPFTFELETLVAKDSNGLYYARLATASMVSVTVNSYFVWIECLLTKK